jgi:hypothetical protein
VCKPDRELCVICADVQKDLGAHRWSAKQSVLRKTDNILSNYPTKRSLSKEWTQGSRVKTRPRTIDFKGDKIRSTPFFGGEAKPSVPCHRFTAC